MYGSGRECRTCKEFKLWEDFNKGNALNKRKSECRDCQKARHKEYKKRPEVKEHENREARRRRKTWSQERKTAAYEKRKEYYEEYFLTYKYTARYRRSRKVREARRRSREKNAGPLHTSSLSVLENYNLNYFNSPDYYHCEYCETIIKETYWLEHVLPLARGGTNELLNLVITCSKCNNTKGAKTLQEFRPDRVKYIESRKII